MPPKARSRRDPLLVRVWASLGATPIHEGWIHDDHMFVDGETDFRSITINPIPEVVNTLVHETLHVLFPQWSENYVRRTTTYLMRRMTSEEIQTYYDEYQKRVRRKKKR